MAAKITFRPIDQHFARLLGELAQKPSAELTLAAQLVSFCRQEGHVCLSLAEVAGRNQPLENFPQEIVPTPALPAWTEKLRKSAVVGAPYDFTPLILDQKNRLYLRRDWEYEQQLASGILARVRSSAKEDFAFSSNGLERFFPTMAAGEVDWQKQAVQTALTKRFCVISGGPGTGKTRTVVVLLAQLLEQARTQGTALKIALCAPTGKAAARLQESIQKNKASLQLPPALENQIPTEASTIHRLLGTIPDSPYFRHHRQRPLVVDVVIVDEASMVDLALMAKLFEAIPAAARVILLGDKDQLSSVEAGAVLGDICRGRPVCQQQNASPTGLSDCLVELKKNYRFGEESGIYRLSQAVKTGAAEAAFTFLQSGRGGSDLSWKNLPKGGDLKRQLKSLVLEHFCACFQMENPAAALAALHDFRILCAVKQGPYGVVALNQLVEEILTEAGLIAHEGGWYRGRPIIVTRNDYNLRLFNGDVGMALPGGNQSELRVFFPAADGTLRQFSTARLPAHETVYAMTVHKSQGSEFKDLLLILPEQDRPILTRELIYTGLTRARQRVEFWADEALARTAIERHMERSSGLRDTLWEPEKNAL